MTTHIEQANSLNPDALVELFTLDLTALTSVYQSVGSGSIYRWTPGSMDYEMRGTVLAGSSASDILLDRALPTRNSVLHYQLFILYANGTTSETVTVSSTSFNSATGGDVVHLASPLAVAPAAGDLWNFASSGSVFFNGNEYQPKPIEAVGWEWNGVGKLARPKLRLTNIDGLAMALVLSFGNLEGAEVTRYRTFQRFLDGMPDADPTAFFEPDRFYIDRLSASNKSFVEFELAAALDFQGVQLPRRICLRDTCDFTYRRWVTTAGGGGNWVAGTCPYNGNAYFKRDRTPTANPAEDDCGKRFVNCTDRYGAAALPFGGFPGIALVNL